MKHILPRPFVGLALFVLALTVAVSAPAQTFRGGIAGTVRDSTGAAVVHAKIVLTGTDTGFSRTMDSTSSGDYSFQDLPLGDYSVEVQGAGFQLRKIDKIAVRPGQVYSLDVKLNVSSSTEQVEVNAAALSLDTVSSTNNSVVNDKAVANIPLNGRDFTQLVKIVPGYNGAGSLNGTRVNQNNWQIDGADNNDIWQNNAAANQGGVGSIAGVTIPIDAIDQFTVQSQSNAEAGRNGGGLISLAIKTGTNKLHGSGYYFNRNEFFAARSPFLTATQRKAKLRNQQFGGSLGGPIVKDKLFFFLNYERQTFTIGSIASTEPTAAYVQAGTALLAKHGLSVNPLSLSVLSLWPQGNKASGPAATGNYFDPRPQKGYSDNVIGNVNYILTPRQTLRAQVFVGTGRQYETIGTNVYEYYEVAPDITQNFSLTHNWAITDHVSNQLLAAVGVFNQTFNDANHSYNVPALGLNTGVVNPALFGAPTISITGIDTTGVTQPLGRKDYTGHITDVATWVTGKHQYRYGGEFRRNYMDLQYQRNVRGSFTFNGTATSNGKIAALVAAAGGTPYATDTSVGGDIRAVADYLAGYVASSSFTQGYLRRSIYQKTFALFAQDQYQVTPSFTLNYGVRYEYNAPFTSDGVLSVYRPGAVGADGYGLVLAGTPGAPTVYPGNKTNVSPRFGFSLQTTPKMVVRGTYGLYYDAPNFNGFFDNRPGNGGAVGSQANNTGATPVRNVSPSFYQWQTGVNPFDITPGPTTIFGLASISPNFRTAYIQNFNLNTQYQLGRSTIATLAYVGSVGRRLFNLSDINQARPLNATPPAGSNYNSSTVEVTRRPIYQNKTVPNYATIGAVNEIQSEGSSSYHSLQATLRTAGYHGLTAQGSYTLGHALDVISSTRGLAAQDSLNLAGDYGNADFDVRHTFNGYVVYEVPQIGHSLPLLTRGWQGNAFVTAFTGTPFSIRQGSDISGSGENQDRVNIVPGVAQKTTTGTTLIVPSTGTPYAALYNVAAFKGVPGFFGTTARNSFRGPGFSTVDASLVKNTTIYEGASLQLRAEMFNIFNRTNLSNPTTSISSSSFGRSTSTRNSGGAPGIGPGEPFNVQFAAKIIF